MNYQFQLAGIERNPLDCVHIGQEVRQDGCESCGGNVRLKIFACSVHRECTLATPLPGITCCQQCADYRASS